MSLTPERIAQLKQSSLEATFKALQGFTGQSVAELHKVAIEAADDVRAPNELAYVKAQIKSADDSAFSVIVDLTSAKHDAFYMDFRVEDAAGGFAAKFLRSGIVKQGGA